MSQTNQLLTALKKYLKAKGLSYRDVAEALELSEASVKRLFSEQSFSLKRLEELCRFLDLSIYDLAKLSKLDSEDEITTLSLEQEKALAADSKLLTYFYLLVNGWRPRNIARRYGLDDRVHTRILIKLDRLRLIELYPRNRVRLLTARRINWRKDGPVRRRYEQQVKAEFLESRFEDTDALLRFESGELSEASIKVIGRKLERLAQEFDELAEVDLGLPREKKSGFGLMLAFRPWTFWTIVTDVPESK